MDTRLEPCSSSSFLGKSSYSQKSASKFSQMYQQTASPTYFKVVFTNSSYHVQIDSVVIIINCMTFISFIIVYILLFFKSRRRNEVGEVIDDKHRTRQYIQMSNYGNYDSERGLHYLSKANSSYGESKLLPPLRRTTKNQPSAELTP